MKKSHCLLLSLPFFLFVALGFVSINVTGQNSKDIDSLKKRLSVLKEPQQMMQILAQLGRNYELTDLDSAAYFYQQALSLAKEQDIPNSVAEYHLNLGRVETKRSNVEMAEKHCAEAIRFSEESKNDSLNIVSNLLMAKIKISGSRFSEVLPLLEPTLEKAIHFSDSLLIAECYDALGSYYFFSDVTQSVDYFIRSLRIQEKYGENERLLTKIINIGSLYGRINQNEKAVEYYLKAVGIAERTGFDYTKSTIYNNLAAIYFSEGDISKSRYYLEEALEIARQMKDERTACGIMVNIGELYQHEKQFDKAMECYQAGLDNPAMKNMPDQEVYTLYNIANLFYETNEYRKSIQYAEKALDLSKKFDFSLHNVELYHLLASAYEQVNDYKSALANQKLYQIFSDSLFNIQSSEKIAEIQAKYDFDVAENENKLLKNENEIKSLTIQKQKTQQILLLIILFLVTGFIALVYRRMKINRKINILLTAKNEEIHLKSKELEKLNQSKDKFFSILAHDLRNPFNSILGSLEILNSEYHHLSEADRFQLIRLTRESAQATDNLLANLLDWSIIQRGKIVLEKEPCNIAGLVQESVDVHQNLALHKEIVINTNVNGEVVFIDKKTIQIVINNLLSNAIKFTPEKGSVLISGRRVDGYFQLVVQDNGIGIPPEILESLFKIDATQSRPGTNHEPGTGLGLILCKDFTELNGGQISVTSEVNKGSCFQVSLLLASEA